MNLIVLALCVVAVSAHSINIEQNWEQWKEFHGKEYEVEEEAKREYIWSQNMKKVIQHNLEEQNGMHTYTMEMNQFADMDMDEFRDLILSRVTRPENVMSFCNKTHDKEDTGSGTVDWRKEGYVTPVKNQKQCGSCWSFSATGSLEGQHFRKTGKLVSLSEQNLVDCSTKEGDHGCQGGLMDNAFQYIELNGGIDTESSYPYTAMNGKCHYSSMNKGATVTQCVDIKRGNEKALQDAVKTVGPISVAIDAGHQSFQLYKSGMYYEPKCSQVNLDHGVLVVGFGVEDDGTEYWLVKNSWGEVWGDKGYIKMSRGKDNNCGIATQASFPTV